MRSIPHSGGNTEKTGGRSSKSRIDRYTEEQTYYGKSNMSRCGVHS